MGDAMKAIDATNLVREASELPGKPPKFVYFSCEAWGGEPFWKFVVHGGDNACSFTDMTAEGLMKDVEKWLEAKRVKDAA